jgi:hypothetical protein
MFKSVGADALYMLSRCDAERGVRSDEGSGVQARGTFGLGLLAACHDGRGFAQERDVLRHLRASGMDTRRRSTAPR